MSATYLYENEHAIALSRLRSLEEIEDEATIAELLWTGVAPGWACLEIGAGAGSIAYWLAERIGGSGQVVATDLQPHLLDASRCEVWRHDIAKDELPLDAFDVIHLRHILVHIPADDHPMVLDKLFRALKPGGTLLMEESDFSTWQVASGVPYSLSTKYLAGVNAVLAVYTERGLDVRLGSHLAGLAQQAGLTVTRESARSRCVTGGSSEASFHETSFQQLCESLTQAQSKHAAAIMAFLPCFDDPDLSYHTRSTIAVCATRSGAFGR